MRCLYLHKGVGELQMICIRAVRICLSHPLLIFTLTSAAFSQTPDEFDPGASNSVFAIAVQADGKILAGGNFTSLAGQPRNYLARLNSDGTLDDSFNPAPSSFVETLVVQPDGKILVGGGFARIGGQTRKGIARLTATGALDNAFNPGAEKDPFNGIVHALAIQSDGKILAGGSFTKLGGQWRTNIARLNLDGTIDSSFNPVAGWMPDVLSVSVQADGKILAGGWFYALGGQPRNGFGRLNPDGTLDTAFDPKPDSSVYSITAQADGQILVGGTFSTIDGKPRNHIARLGANGAADATFNPGASGTVYSIVVQADGKILLGGSFTNLAGQPRTNIGRLNPSGSPDATFNTSANDRVLSLTIQPDGKLLVGGDFTTLGGLSRSRIGRLTNPDVATQELAVDPSGITWLRGGSTPEVWRTSFELSTNGTDWTDLGAGTRVSGGWQLSAVTLPAAGIIRARGFVTSGEWSGSSWFVQSMLSLSPLRPTILVNDGNFGFRSSYFGFNVSGSPGQSVVLEGSTNLMDWLALATNVLSPNPCYFSDPASAGLPQRYYRVRLE